ncbi:MAG: GNAT family N-acetyltransferase [Pseudomonadales bacterium]|nr:GNAT family N-acetyltransferase [Pseudomonadales bacterium]
MSEQSLHMRLAKNQDCQPLQAIRAAAFAPVFASFRQILGDVIYEAAQAHEDADQEKLLNDLFNEDSDWQLWVAEKENEILGFVSFRLDQLHGSGEIGLNAVSPQYSGKGIGTAMYDFVLEQMRAAGMRVATVATGADPSHSAARRAYEKAGFNVRIPSVWLCRTL